MGVACSTRYLQPDLWLSSLVLLFPCCVVFWSSCRCASSCCSQSADRLSYKEIAETTEIPTADLKRALQSMSLMKGKNVLRKEPVGKDVNDDDVFHFNDKFREPNAQGAPASPSLCDLINHVLALE